MVSTRANTLDAFTRNPATTAIDQQQFRADGWGQPVSLGGSWLSGPAAAADSAGTILLAAVGPNRKVSIRTSTAGQWSGWSAVDGTVTTTLQPAVASFGKDSFALVVRGQDSHAWIRFRTAGRWSAWRALGGTLTSPPAATGLPNKSVGIVAAGGNGVLWTTTVPAVATDPAPKWTNIGGKTSQTPGFMVDPLSGLWEIATTDPAGNLMQRQPADKTHWTWSQIGSGATSGVAVTVSGKGEADLLALGSRGALSHAAMLHRYFTGQTPWYQWHPFVAVQPARTGPGTTSRVSVDHAGDAAAEGAFSPVISADGRYAAFSTDAAMVPGDTDKATDVYVRDRQLNTLSQVSVSSAGAQDAADSAEPTISGDGRYIAFTSTGAFGLPGNGTTRDIFVRDTKLGTTTRLLTADGTALNDSSSGPALSADGRHLVFESHASNLVPGDANGRADVFLRDLGTGKISLVSAAMDGSPAGGASYGSVPPDISADGRYVTFHSEAPNLVPSDTNKLEDLFLRDTQDNVTSRLNVGPDNLQADRRAGRATISGDGRYIAFESAATDLVTGDTNGVSDVFVRDTIAATTTRVSLGDGRQLAGSSWQSAISGDGKSVAFASFDDQVVPDDTNGNADGFVADLATGHVTRVTRGYSGAQSAGKDGPYDLRLSANGSVVVYTSWADDLVPRDLNEKADVFAYTR